MRRYLPGDLCQVLLRSPLPPMLPRRIVLQNRRSRAELMRARQPTVPSSGLTDSQPLDVPAIIQRVPGLAVVNRHSTIAISLAPEENGSSGILVARLQ